MKWIIQYRPLPATLRKIGWSRHLLCQSSLDEKSSHNQDAPLLFKDPITLKHLYHSKETIDTNRNWPLVLISCWISSTVILLNSPVSSSLCCMVAFLLQLVSCGDRLTLSVFWSDWLSEWLDEGITPPVCAEVCSVRFSDESNLLWIAFTST